MRLCPLHTHLIEPHHARPQQFPVLVGQILNCSTHVAPLSEQCAGPRIAALAHSRCCDTGIPLDTHGLQLSSPGMSAGCPSGSPVPARPGTRGCLRSSQGGHTGSRKPPGVAKHTSLVQQADTRVLRRVRLRRVKDAAPSQAEAVAMAVQQTRSVCRAGSPAPPFTTGPSVNHCCVRLRPPTHHSDPCISTTLLLPAPWCSLSMFCVTTLKSTPRSRACCSAAARA